VVSLKPVAPAEWQQTAQEEDMAKFIVHSHGRLQEWVAEEKGYFAAEGLDYEIVNKPLTLTGLVGNPSQTPEGFKAGAYEAFAQGKDAAVSCACHWTVTMAAAADHGRMWGGCYSVVPCGIFVPPESEIRRPADLAGVEIHVGYRSGSHYTTIQALESFLEPEQIRLRFGGLLYDRLDLLVDRKVEAATAFGAPYYVLEQLGFRKILDATFMIAAMLARDVTVADARKYFRALRRAQIDIDLMPQRYEHHYLKELPRRYHALVDVRTFGPGERLVFEPYTKEMYESTRRWVARHAIFPAEERRRSYEEAVVTA
jgi:NitT/TauT family transport system substrate-binding protein